MSVRGTRSQTQPPAPLEHNLLPPLAHDGLRLEPVRWLWSRCPVWVHERCPERRDACPHRVIDVDVEDLIAADDSEMEGPRQLQPPHVRVSAIAWLGGQGE